MALYRYGASEYKKQKKRLYIAVTGTILLLLALFFFGLPILENFSLLVDALRGKSPASQTQSERIPPPALDPLESATNSAALTVTGLGIPQATLIIYLNDSEVDTVQAGEDGAFKSSFLGSTGENKIYAKTLGENDIMSEPSNIVTTSVINKNPTLEVTSPEENASYFFEENRINVEGKTETENTVTVNGRIVILRSDGTFRTTFQLNEGENTITIEAKDIAGNTTVIERKVTYQK